MTGAASEQPASGGRPERAWLDRHWRLLVLLFWLGACAFLIYSRWNAIQWFSLGDTDDNMRIMQVRALIGGQDWYDLRQYRLDPPFGADIHWARLVDLPIAAIKLALTPLIGGLAAEKAAIAVAPLLPMGVAMAAIAVIVRRTVSPRAFLLAIALLLCAHSTRSMWSPTRIDHHGWQLALLAIAALALTDPRRARGGALLGVATALSLSIGLEMLLYLALAGAAIVLMWVRDAGGARRLAAYGASLAGGTALAYLLFASYANRAPVCDALSPVWLSVVVAAGAVAVLLAWLPGRSPWLRLALAATGGAALAAGFVLAWPGCAGRLEGVSDQAQALWLNNVREAMPVWRHGVVTATAIMTLPAAGLAGYAAMLWRTRRDETALTPWLALTALAVLAAALLFWQTRAAPAAQLLAVPGATALVWLVAARIQALRSMPLRVLATVTAFLLISGLLPQQATRAFPQPKKRTNPAVALANSRCPTLPALRPIALVPKGRVLTFVDLGPRLIAVTHHDAVAGPYHRNDDDIVDVMTAFRGSADFARRIVAKRRIDYVLICPNLSESTVYTARARQGFYVQLNRSQVPDWLAPIPLPANSPYKMWRVIKPGS